MVFREISNLLKISSYFVATVHEKYHAVHDSICFCFPCSYVPDGVDSIYLEIFDEVSHMPFALCAVVVRITRLHLQGLIFFKNY